MYVGDDCLQAIIADEMDPNTDRQHGRRQSCGIKTRSPACKPSPKKDHLEGPSAGFFGSHWITYSRLWNFAPDSPRRTFPSADLLRSCPKRTPSQEKVRQQRGSS